MAKAQAVSYVRVSGKGQADGDGPERQRLAIDRFAKSSGLVLLEEFLEKNWNDIGAIAPELPDNISPFIGSLEVSRP